MSATAQASAYWAGRHATYGAGWLDHYWNDVAAPHRHELVQEIQGLHATKPIRAVTEIGCNVGTNLRLIQDALPHVTVAGCDVNVEAIRFALEHFPGGAFSPSTALEYLGSHRPGGTDVAFTCYALAYLDPLDVPRAIRGLLKIARRAVVIAEPMPREGEAAVSTQLKSIPEWRHPYAQILKAMGVPRHRLRIREIAPADDLNVVLTLEV